MAENHPQHAEMTQKLAKLGARIDEALERVRLQHAVHSEHGPTGEDLKKRYQLLQKQADAEAHDLEEHGHHVSALERSVMAWLDGLQFDHPRQR